MPIGPQTTSSGPTQTPKATDQSGEPFSRASAGTGIQNTGRGTTAEPESVGCGCKGLQGTKGPSGDKGPVGERGPSGARGRRGWTGEFLFAFSPRFLYRRSSAIMSWSSTHVLFGSLGHLLPGAIPTSI